MFPRRPFCVGLVWLAAGPAGAAVVVCPAETFPDADAWRAWVADAAAGRPDVGRLQDLLDAHGTDLMATPDGGLLSLRQAVATLPAAVRAAVAGPYDARFGPAARGLLGRVLTRPDHTPADLYAVAVRYPLAVTDARAAAADRAAAQGDTDAAAVLAGRPPPASAVGPVPFDVPWYAKLNNFGQPRAVPVATAEVMFTADDRTIAATRADGSVVWHWDPPAGRPVASGRGPVCVPAVLSDTAGKPQLVVFRHGAHVSALRAADGRLDWTTTGDPAWADATALGSPAVAGRLVLFVVRSADGLQLAAADVTDGRPIWRCPLGTVAADARSFEPFTAAATPTVAGDLVIVPDNAGAVVAVNRFGGDVRWARPYPPATAETAPVFGLRLPVLPRAALLRWSAAAAVAGEVVFVAPQDTADALGLDRLTGRVLWHAAAVPDDATCVGVAGGRFLLGGQDLTLLDPATGTVTQTYSPPAGVRLTGPPVVRGGRVLAPSNAGVLTPADEGTLVAATGRSP